MSATNHTSNYNLNQFIGTDKPSWLVDYNGDMLAIDTAMKANQTAAGNAQTKADTADGKADTNALAITTLDNQINTPSTGLASVVASHTSDISGITGEIGTTPLTTTAQTLTGAIEEVKGLIPSLTSVLKYGGSHTFTVEYDSVKSISTALDELYAALTSYVASKASSYRFRVVAVLPDTQSYDALYNSNPLLDSAVNERYGLNVMGLLGSPVVAKYLTCVVKTTGSFFTIYDFSTDTYTDSSSTVPTAGSARLVIEEFAIE